MGAPETKSYSEFQTVKKIKQRNKLQANLYFMGSLGAKPLLYVTEQSTDEIFSFRWKLCFLREFKVISPINNLHSAGNINIVVMWCGNQSWRKNINVATSKPALFNHT